MKKSFLILISFILLSNHSFTQVFFEEEKAPTCEQIFEFVGQPAEYQGGMKELYAWLSKEIQYPAEAKDNGIQGKVFVKFVITKNGAVGDAKILNLGQTHASLEKEALRLIKSIKNWKPGENNGKTVCSYFTVPVNFSLSNQTTSAVKSNTKTLVEANYSIKYPSDWELNQSGHMGLSFILFSPLETSQDEFRENVNLLIQDLSGYNLNLDKYVNISIEQINSMITNSKLIESIRIKSESDEYHRLIYTGDQGNFNLKFIQYFWVKGEKAYVLTLTCENSKFFKYKEVGYGILNSFKIKGYGQIEKSVTIGKQVWMTENLNVDKFRNGDPIPEAKTDEEWEKAGENGEPAWCYYNNDPTNGGVFESKFKNEVFGKLYNWFAVNDPRGLAPKGFHIPSDHEFDVLERFLGKDAGKKMKSTEFPTNHDEETGNGTNESGFSGLPGGIRTYKGTFELIGEYGFWWSSTEYGTSYAWDRSLKYYNGDVNRGDNYKEVGLSVRCLRD